MSAEKLKIVIAPAGGAFGTALSVPIAAGGHEVVLAFRDDEKARAFEGTRQIDRLESITFPDHIKVAVDTAQTIQSANLIVVATPALFVEPYYKERIQPARRKDTPVLSIAKGVMRIGNRYQRPSEMILSLDSSVIGLIAVLSGPNFAPEIARGLPFATVIASENSELAEDLVNAFAFNPRFRAYPSTDVIGVELGGAFKNVIAIAAGICDGLQFGESARTALIERGKVEIISLGMAMGGQRETLAEGLSGDADLWMTCNSKQSRNHEYGEGLGQGRDPINLLEEFQRNKKTVEGFETARVAWKLARKFHLKKTPIINAVYALLHKGINLDVIVNGFMWGERVYEDGRPLIKSLVG